MGEPRIPNYQFPPVTHDTYLEQVAWEGLLQRFNRKSRAEVEPTYKERLKAKMMNYEHLLFSSLGLHQIYQDMVSQSVLVVVPTDL